MASFTSTSPITKEIDITGDYHANQLNKCKTHDRKPMICEIRYSRNKIAFTATCSSFDCSVLELSKKDIVAKWNRFNPK